MNWETSADIARAATIGANLWLVALLVRIVWLRRKQPYPVRQAQVSNLTTLAFAGYVMLNLSDRADHIGTRWTWELVASMLCVALGIIGVLRRVKVGVDRPRKTEGPESSRWKMEERRHRSDAPGVDRRR